MTYNYYYELCSLIMLIALSVQFFSIKKFPTKTNQLFMVIMLCSILDLALDILGCITIERINELPAWVNYLVNNTFYCLQVFIPVLMSSYILYAVGKTYAKNPQFLLLLVPAVVEMFILVTNFLTHWIFGVFEIEGSLSYVKGPLYMSLYAGEAFYILASIALTLAYRKALTGKQIGTIFLFVGILIGATAVQIMVPGLLLTGMAIVISIMLMDVTLQNPEDMVDRNTGAFNSIALEVFLSGEIDRRHALYLTVVDIDGLDTTDRENGLQLSFELETSIGRFFKGLPLSRVWVFRYSKSRFIVVTKEQSDMEKVSKEIADRFNKEWNLGVFNMDLLAKVICISTNTSIQFSTAELLTLIEEFVDSEGIIKNQRARVVIDSRILASLRRRQIIEESMRHSVKSKEGLYLCYQPIIPTDPTGPIAAEALLRFNDPSLGAISPAEFIPIVEKCGLASFIDTYVISESCKFLLNHREVDLLHINLSATEFFHNPVKRISEIVRSYGINPTRICFEITETSAARYPEKLASFMNQMTNLGFSFALDDYGTGYANIQQVLQLPFRMVKVDKVLLKDNSKIASFLAYTLKMFHEMEIETVIEGVETKDQFDRVSSYGVTFIQGFLFSPPLTDKDYLTFIQNRKDNSRS